MRPKPIAVAMAILVNSFLKIKVKFKTFLIFSSYSHLSGLCISWPAWWSSSQTAGGAPLPAWSDPSSSGDSELHDGWRNKLVVQHVLDGVVRTCNSDGLYPGFSPLRCISTWWKKSWSSLLVKGTNMGTVMERAVDQAVRTSWYESSLWQGDDGLPNMSRSNVVSFLTCSWD